MSLSARLRQVENDEPLPEKPPEIDEAAEDSLDEEDVIQKKAKETVESKLADLETEAKPAPVEKEEPDAKAPSEKEEEQKGEAEGEEKQEETAPKEAEGFDDELLAIAAELGVGEKEARAFETPAKLENALLLVASQRQKLTEEAAKKEEPKEEEKKEEEKAPSLRIELGDDFDENQLVEAINSQLATIEKRMADGAKVTAEQLQASGQEVAGLKERLFFSGLNDTLHRVAPEYEDVYGKGNIVDLPRDSEEWKGLTAIIQRMSQQAQGAKAAGLPEPPDEQLVRDACLLAHGSRSSEQKDEDKEAKRKERREQFLNLPAGKTPGREPAGKRSEEKAILNEMLTKLRG